MRILMKYNYDAAKVHEVIAEAWEVRELAQV